MAVSLKKIDIHVHTTTHADIGMPRPNGENFASPEQIREKYDAWGIEYGVMLPEITNECAYIVQSNEEAYLTSRDYPETLRHWCMNLSPRMGDNDAHTDFSRFIEHYKALGAVGVGELTFNLPFDDPMTDNLLSHCEVCDMPVIFHIAPQIFGCYGVYDELGLPRMEKMLNKHPHLKFVGHSQPFWAEISGDISSSERNGYPSGRVTDGRLAHLLRNYDNLFCDMSAGSGSNAFTRDPDYAFRFIDEFSDRLLFGTDICAPSNFFPLSHWLDSSNSSGFVSDKAYRRICRENAERVFGI